MTAAHTRRPCAKRTYKGLLTKAHCARHRRGCRQMQSHSWPARGVQALPAACHEDAQRRVESKRNVIGYGDATTRKREHDDVSTDGLESSTKQLSCVSPIDECLHMPHVEAKPIPPGRPAITSRGRGA
jgi:hypothetical protein